LYLFRSAVHSGHFLAVTPAGTGFVLDIDDDFDPRPMARQGTAVAFGRFRCGRLPRRLGCRRQTGLLLGHQLLQILDALLQRLVIELFGAAAEPMPLQAGDQQLQPLDLGQRGAQHRLQRGRIVGQLGGGGEHGSRLNRHGESAPMNRA
jgi:hypothetical protein